MKSFIVFQYLKSLGLYTWEIIKYLDLISQNRFFFSFSFIFWKLISFVSIFKMCLKLKTVGYKLCGLQLSKLKLELFNLIWFSALLYSQFFTVYILDHPFECVLICFRIEDFFLNFRLNVIRRILFYFYYYLRAFFYFVNRHQKEWRLYNSSVYIFF